MKVRRSWWAALAAGGVITLFGPFTSQDPGPVLPRMALLIAEKGGGMALYLNTQPAETPSKQLAIDANRLAWSPNGRRLYIHKAPDGPLWVWQAGREGVHQVASQVREAKWSPDSSRLLYFQRDGAYLYQASFPGSQPSKLATGATTGAWSPTGARIALATADSIAVRSSPFDDDSVGRILLEGRTATAMDWAQHERVIAYADPGIGGKDPELRVVSINGELDQALAPGAATRVSWSRDGARLLLGGERGTRLLALAGTRKDAPIEAQGDVVWSSSRDYVGRKGSAIWRFGVEAGNKPWVVFDAAKLEGFERLEAAAVQSAVSLTNADLVADPFSKAPRPTSGQARLVGALVDLDTESGQATIQVEKVLTLGREQGYPRPVTQVVQLTAGTKRLIGGNFESLILPDLRMDDQVCIMVNAPNLSNQPLNAIFVAIEGDKLDSPFTPSKHAPHISGNGIEYDRVSRERIIVPMTFPVIGITKPAKWSDWFLRPRGNGTRRHHGQDIMAPKMSALVAVFSGRVELGVGRGNAGNYVRIHGDNGWKACYYHVNNDLPGLDDGKGTGEYAFAPGLRNGQRVYEGQFLGWVGDSGNAESTGPHCHFELWDQKFRAVVNAHHSLAAAKRLTAPHFNLPPVRQQPLYGEARLDGVVRVIDPSKRSLQISLLAKTQGSTTTGIMQPVREWIKFEDASKILLRSRSELPVKVEDLRKGFEATVIGAKPQRQPAYTGRVGVFASK